MVFGLKGKLIWWAILSVIGGIIGLLIGLKLSIFDGFAGGNFWLGWVFAALAVVSLCFVFKKRK